MLSCGCVRGVCTARAIFVCSCPCVFCNPEVVAWSLGVWSAAQVFLSYLPASQAAAGTQSDGTLSPEGSHPSPADLAPGCINRGTAGAQREGTRPALPVVGEECGLRQVVQRSWTSDLAVRVAEENAKASSGDKGSHQTEDPG